ncbi:DUF6089 family protein [Flammeovirga pacifica]|nr:DUF6089 family protein [Flammeovirga pacifica]
MNITYLRNTILTLLFSLFMTKHVQAQDWILGGGIGVSAYAGDVSPLPHPLDYRVGVKGFAKYKMNNFLHWRTDLHAAWNTGSDSRFDKPLPKSRNASFQNVMINLATGFEYNFLGFREDKNKRDSFTPYFFMELGAGLFPIIETTTENPPALPWAVTLPFGVGFKKRISTHWDFGMELSVTKPLWSDKTDTIYRDDDPSTPITEQLTVPSWRDNYYFLGFTWCYNIINVNCPKSPRIR